MSEYPGTHALDTWTTATVNLVDIATTATYGTLLSNGGRKESGNGAAPATQPQSETDAVLAGWDVTVSERDVGKLAVRDRVEFTGIVSDADIRRVTGGGGTPGRGRDADHGTLRREGRSPAHDAVANCLVGAALAHFPGMVTYLSQDLRFHQPIRAGSRVTGLIKLVEDIGDGHFRARTTLETPEALVADGEAFVIIRDPD